MNKIISKEHFSEKVFKLVIEAPLIARSRKAGHFVIVRVGEKGERMPLTIAAADPVKGTITLVVQEVGLSSTRLCELNEGDYITDVVGPLGQATHIENFGTVVCAGGGVGVAPMLPIVQALKAAGNRVIAVLAGRTKELIILEKEMRESADEVIIMTDDGSYGRKGLVTEGVEEVIKREKVDKCFAIGPAIMMKFVCLLTKKYEILGAERAIIIYRRSEEEMPARLEEVKHAKEEGVEFLTLHNPIAYIADEQGKVKQIVLQKMELGEPDASGRRSPVPIPGATETLDIDLAIVSVGVSPNPIVPSSIKGLEKGRKGTIAVNENMQSSIPTIYAGGDIVRGGATVILAMGDGRKAAAAMNEQLKKS